MVRNMRENAAKLAEENQGKTVSKQFTNPRHRILCYMAASGATQKEIALATKFNISHVQGLMTRGVIKTEIRKIQDKIFSAQPKKKFAQAFPEAFDTARAIMKDTKVKPGVRAAQARDFMDRHAGKPLQRTENDTTIISELIVRLDESISRPVEQDASQGDNVVIDVVPTKPAVEPQKQQSEIDVDSWIDENLGD